MGDARPEGKTGRAARAEIFVFSRNKSLPLPSYPQTRTEENEPMKTNYELAPKVRNPWRFRGWPVFGIALLSFAAGSVLAARLMHVNQVRADSNRVFELRVYHTLPGKAPALESIFRDVSKLIAKHDINVVGYWVPTDDPAWTNTFIYLVAYPSQEEAKKNWAAVHADPAFPQYREQAALVIEKVKDEYNVEEVYMRPTDYSGMK